MYRYFKWQTREISHENTWTWIKKGNLRRERESFLIAIENNAIRTYSVKVKLLWNMKVTITLIIIGALGTVLKGFINDCKNDPWKTKRGYPNYSIVDISQNTEKSPGDLRRHAVTQTSVKDYQLTLV